MRKRSPKVRLLSITATATDADNDAVFFTAALIQGAAFGNLPVGAEFDGGSGQLTWLPSSTQAGDYRIRITASDGAGSRSEDVLVTVTNTNQAPVMNTLPGLFTREGDQMIFAVNAGDADGEPLIFSYDGPAINGFNFDPITRTVIWDVDFDSAGNYALPFSVTDPSGASDSIEVEVQVIATNRAPSIDAPQLRNAQIGETFSLVIPTADLDGDTVTLSATDLPEGATLNVVAGEDVLEWTPQSFQAGTYTVRLTADDGDLQTNHTMTLIASLDPASPDLRLVLTPSFPATPGQTVTIEPIADSDVAIGEATLSINGQTITLDELGRGSFVAEAPGRFEITASVTDIEGRTTTVAEPLFVRDPADRTAPRIEITEFAPPIVAETKELMFDIFDDGLAEYKVELVPRGGGMPTVIGEGTTSIVRMVVIDPSKYENGFYTAVVTASDFGGLTSTESFDLEINSVDKTGSVQESATDITFTLAGIDLDVTRHYSSISTNQADSNFGTAWSWPLLDPQIALEAKSADAFAGLADGDRLYLTLPTGQRVGYTFTPNELTDEASGVQTFTPAWTADDGVTWSLESFSNAPLRRSGIQYFVVGTGLPYSPTIASDESNSAAFTLVSPTGQRHELTEETPDSFLLSRIASSDSSNSLRVTGSGIVASDGSRLTIVRDGEGQISELVGPNSQHVVYRYDDEGQMNAAIDAVSGQRTFYSYDELGRLNVVAPSAAEGTYFAYIEDGTPSKQTPIVAHIGGTRALFSAPISGNTAGGNSDRYAFTITEGELRSSPTGGITIGVEVTSTDFNPAAPTLSSIPTGYRFTETGRSISLFTINRAGTHTFNVSGGDGNYVAAIYLGGDIDRDGRVNGFDNAALTAALGSNRGDSNYNANADVDRNGSVNAVDRNGLSAVFGFVANRAPGIASSMIQQSVLGSSIIVDMKALATDPEEDQIVGHSPVPFGATYAPLGGGLARLSFPISEEPIGFDFDISDGILDHGLSRIDIQRIEMDLVGIQLSLDDVDLRVGESARLEVYGRLRDGTVALIPNSEVTFLSNAPETVFSHRHRNLDFTRIRFRHDCSYSIWIPKGDGSARWQS